jgi:hypothetical protein
MASLSEHNHQTKEVSVFSLGNLKKVISQNDIKILMK